MDQGPRPVSTLYAARAHPLARNRLPRASSPRISNLRRVVLIRSVQRTFVPRRIGALCPIFPCTQTLVRFSPPFFYPPSVVYLVSDDARLVRSHHEKQRMQCTDDVNKQKEEGARRGSMNKNCGRRKAQADGAEEADRASGGRLARLYSLRGGRFRADQPRARLDPIDLLLRLALLPRAQGLRRP